VSTRPAPQPFLLNFLLNHGAERRSGKEVSNDRYGVPPPVNDVYGAPEVKDGYGVPETSTSSGYEAPKAPSYTTTLTPCSYQAPTTAAPSYGSPRSKHIFPDVLGFIGNLFKKQEPVHSNCLTAPQDTGYGAPQDASYNAPEESGYEAPEAISYKAPESSSYEAPEASSYDAPEASSYEAPEASSYEAPDASSYEAPEASSYEAPAPQKPVYNTPEEGSTEYEAPESSYNEPEIAINERANLL